MKTIPIWKRLRNWLFPVEINSFGFLMEFAKKAGCKKATIVILLAKERPGEDLKAGNFSDRYKTYAMVRIITNKDRLLVSKQELADMPYGDYFKNFAYLQEERSGLLRTFMEANSLAERIRMELPAAEIEILEFFKEVPMSAERKTYLAKKAGNQDIFATP